MDLLGFFKEKIGFLEIKIRLTPLISLSHTGSLRSGSDAAWLPVARAWLSRHWLPQAIPRGSRAAGRGVGRRVAVTGAA
jgi:hypothetical protein